MKIDADLLIAGHIHTIRNMNTCKKYCPSILDVLREDTFNPTCGEAGCPLWFGLLDGGCCRGLRKGALFTLERYEDKQVSLEHCLRDVKTLGEFIERKLGDKNNV